jgi:[ribulose-bisphosphate carboxylase]-lysine N-methyltransferase
VLEVAGLKEQPAFTIRAFEDPPPELRVFMRLLNLKGEDAFLLEAIFRQEAWGLISDPVSKANENDACTTMISGEGCCFLPLFSFHVILQSKRTFI